LKKKNKWSLEVETEKKHLFSWSSLEGTLYPYVCMYTIN